MGPSEAHCGRMAFPTTTRGTTQLISQKRACVPAHTSHLLRTQDVVLVCASDMT